MTKAYPPTRIRVARAGGTERTYPTTGPATLTAGSPSTWTQLVAATAADAYLTEVSFEDRIIAGNGAGESSPIVELGLGAAGGEVTCAMLGLSGSVGSAGGGTTAPVTDIPAPLPVFIPAGTAISARTRGANSPFCMIRLVDAGDLTEL